MAVVILTSDQRINIKGNSRYQALVRQAVENQANYWVGQSGASLDGTNAARWAKSRYLSTGIILNPNAQVYDAWVTRFTIILKSVPVVDEATNSDPEAGDFYDKVLDYMLANSKFDELADLSFNVEIQKIQF